MCCFIKSRHMLNMKKQKIHIKTIDLISAPIWNKEFQLPDELYSTSDIQYYFEYIYLKNVG